MEFKPEKIIELKLWDWLKTKGNFVKEVYFNNSKNALDWKYFSVNGDQHKPDFIVKIDRGFGIEYIAIEIKDNSKNSQVYDATKILNLYYKKYLNKETIYLIENKEININYFLIATQGSPEGKLLNSDNKIESNIFDVNISHRANLVNFGHEPEYEWNVTSQFTRQLFSLFRQFRLEEKIIKKGGPAIGILTSEILLSWQQNDFPEYICSNIPKMFIMNYNNYNLKSKAKWGCRFWEI